VIRLRLVGTFFANPPPEVRKRLQMKDNEVLRILKAVYGLLHAPRMWGKNWPLS
jgi:hypothetical protein